MPRVVTLEQRIEEKVERDPNSGCWLWAAANDGRHGYGNIRMADGMRKAHRVSYEFYCEPIPSGYEIDHLCRTPACVNPKHLEAVTRKENMRRAPKEGLKLGGRANGDRLKAKTHCPQGHSYAEHGVARKEGWRHCRICRNARQIEYMRRKAVAA